MRWKISSPTEKKDSEPNIWFVLETLDLRMISGCPNEIWFMPLISSEPTMTDNKTRTQSSLKVDNEPAVTSFESDTYGCQGTDKVLEGKNVTVPRSQAHRIDRSYGELVRRA